MSSLRLQYISDKQGIDIHRLRHFHEIPGPSPLWTKEAELFRLIDWPKRAWNAARIDFPGICSIPRM